MLTQHIALVPEAGGVSPSELLRVSAALQKQIATQFGPLWDVRATIDPFAELEDVPAGYWPVILSKPDRAGQRTGIHFDDNGQPYACVMLSSAWSIMASHVCLEMLVNPFAQRTITASSPRSDQGPVEVLVEACGAFGEALRAYLVNDVPVADFCTPAFYKLSGQSLAAQYSFQGSLSAPLQVLRGGHLTWFDTLSNSWWLRSFRDENPNDISLGALRRRSESVRELVKRHEPGPSELPALQHEAIEVRVRWQWLREQASAASRARARRLKQQLHGSMREGDEALVVEGVPDVERSRRSTPPPLPAPKPPLWSNKAEASAEPRLELTPPPPPQQPEPLTQAAERSELSPTEANLTSLDPYVSAAETQTRPATQRPEPPKPKQQIPSIAPLSLSEAPLGARASQVAIALAAVAVMGVTVATCMRGDKRAAARQAAPQVQGAPRAQAMARPPSPAEPAGVEAARTSPHKSARRTHGADGSRSSEQALADAPTTRNGKRSSPAEDDLPGQASAARDQEGERANVGQPASTASRAADGRTDAGAALENLFDTRR